MPGVAADGEYAAGFDVMMFIEHEAIGVIGDGAFVDHRLAVVLASAFQCIEFEQPIGRREKFQIANARLQRRIGDRQQAIGCQARIGEAVAIRQLLQNAFDGERPQ